ncbi:MAG: hypothetical protein IT265_07185 [Saprospiraceae bacterium]|jgi:hypothetical protein|nr:hypothetical protein [Saprospiraceae bacterium]
MNQSKFSLGQTVMSRSIADLVGVSDKFSSFVFKCLFRHKACNWGDLDPEDQEANNLALEYGSRILSSYKIPFSFGYSESKVWIITEADRSVTTILFPSDY